jgi:uncharacterized protein (TIGR04222 family)
MSQPPREDVVAVAIDTFGIAIAGLLFLAAVVRLAPQRKSRTRDIDPCGVGYIRGGKRSAVRVALVMLYRRGAVDAGQSGTVRRDGPLPDDTGPLERAVAGALYGSVSLPMLMVRSSVERELAELRGRLVEAGLMLAGWRWATLQVALCALPPVGLAWLFSAGWAWPRLAAVAVYVLVAAALWRLPRCTARGGRVMRRLRARHPVPERRKGAGAPALSPHDAGMAVALHGNAALLVAAPTFARESGLLHTRRWVSNWLGDVPAAENEQVIDAFIAGDYGEGGLR